MVLNYILMCFIYGHLSDSIWNLSSFGQTYDNWKNASRVEPPCGDVEVELADGDAQAADTEVAEPQDSAAVGHYAWERVSKIWRLHLIQRGASG